MTEVEIRTEGNGEHGAVLDVIRAAFGDEGDQVARLWDDVTRARLVQASIVAHDGDRVVGHVGVSHAWLDARERLVDVSILSPLSTSPDLQQQGIGTRLIEAALAAADAQGSPALFLEGSPDFYGRRGFSRASAAGFDRPSLRIPDPAFQVMPLRAHEPWMTGRVVYRDVWWAHDSTGLRDPLLGELEAQFADAQ